MCVVLFLFVPHFNSVLRVGLFNLRVLSLIDLLCIELYSLPQSIPYILAEVKLRSMADT